MSCDAVVRVEGVSKCFPIYSKPSDRLRQYGVRWMRQALPHAMQQMLPRNLVDRDFHRLFWALRDVSFEVKRGESVGILGMNGAGKSTLLQVVAGIVKQTTGEIKTHGRVAGLFELGSGFNPEFTGRENVFLNAAMLGFRRAEVLDRFDEIERFAGIGDFIDRPVKTYSSGMMVRLAFAVQVQLNPDILIVDEALAVGDALFQKRCYERIERFLSDGGSLLFVSHDQESVRTLTDRALLLKDGMAVCMGTSSDVVLEYRRLLHAAENEAARDVLQYLSNSVNPASRRAEPLHDAVATARIRSTDMSFGDLDVEVLNTEIKNAEGTACDLFYPGDQIDIRVRYRINTGIRGINLGVRLRNKEGVKIYSGGSFNSDLLSTRPADVVRTWDRRFRAGEVIELCQRFECRLGDGYYEVQAYAAEERLLMPGHQRMLHWVDESAFFRVSMNKLERWYGGVCDICPTTEVKVISASADAGMGEGLA